MKSKAQISSTQKQNSFRKWVKYVLWVGGFFGVMVFWFSLPQPLFEVSYSTVLKDENGKLMGAKIAEDEQWRFPGSPEIPDKYEQALLEFEDHRFYNHPGIDPLALGRAIVQNLQAGTVVSGASTLTMQVIRLAEGNKARTVPQKLKEMVMALRLELTFSKKEILALYAAHAPFGGNVVGLEAASWRYFGRSPAELSWAESATLAVLPNSPALIHPGRNRTTLRQKRDHLLQQLLAEEKLDSLSYQLALAESIPEHPVRLPADAPHVLAGLYTGAQKGENFTSTLSRSLQQKANQAVGRHQSRLRGNGIHHAGAVILDVKNQTVKAYVGNMPGNNSEEGDYVDVVSAPRSTGSILKPFLYMLKLNEGELLPQTLVPDIPSQFSGYTPENFTRTYSGAVPAADALARSLNVPAVYMLQEYGVPKFHYYLQAMGMKTIAEEPEHYGLSLILGGAESTLLEITSAYGSVAAMLNAYRASDPKTKVFTEYKYGLKNGAEVQKGDVFALNPGAVWNTLEAMLEVNRPEEEAFWKQFQHARKVAWKTGTSFGYRDGWAVGVTPEYAVGVWVGNADGEGRPGLTGIRAAAPILFDIFDVLPETSWFHEPVYEMKEMEICSLSGYKAGAYCEHTKQADVSVTGGDVGICPFHRRIHVDENQEWQLNSSCADVGEMQAANWFVLPPIQQWYFKKAHPEYKSLPPFRPDCKQAELADMKLIYPYRKSTIFVPIEMDGQQGKTVFEVAHRGDKATVYWHLDHEFIGQTNRIHQMSLAPKPGPHTLTVVDDAGQRLEYQFTVVSSSHEENSR